MVPSAPTCAGFASDAAAALRLGARAAQGRRSQHSADRRLAHGGVAGRARCDRTIPSSSVSARASPLRTITRPLGCACGRVTGAASRLGVQPGGELGCDRLTAACDFGCFARPRDAQWTPRPQPGPPSARLKTRGTTSRRLRALPTRWHRDVAPVARLGLASGPRPRCRRDVLSWCITGAPMVLDTSQGRAYPLLRARFAHALGVPAVRALPKLEPLPTKLRRRRRHR